MAHRSYEELEAILAEARNKVQVGSRYEHYRNPDQPYLVLNVALDEATERPCVVYQSGHTSGIIWVRDLEDWCAEIESESGEKVPRFMCVE